MARKKGVKKRNSASLGESYDELLRSMVDLLESARSTSARAVNAIMTATYWEIGRRIVDVEQGGESRAEYGEELIPRLAADLTERFGRGFGRANLEYMRRFFVLWQIPQTVSGESVNAENSISQTPSGEFADTLPIQSLAARFPLPWSHYVKLLTVEDEDARSFYEAEALRSGWTVRQLKRQIDSQFYQRTLLSKNKSTMLKRGAEPKPSDLITPDEEIKDPFVLEFLDLKDEYSESDLEYALIHKLEEFLLELGGDFTFVGRQRRLRIGQEWYRIDLLFYHRRLRCLVVIDLKIGKFSHADAGQMHMYLNYVAEHWTLEDENPPVGIILCAQKDHAVAKYALDGLPNKVMAGEYKLALPSEDELVAELERTQRALQTTSTRLEADTQKKTSGNKPAKKKSTKRTKSKE